MFLSEKIVNVGVGQCGNNFAKGFEKLGHQAYYINTSLEDLEAIGTSPSNTYHIKGTKGMAKNIDLSAETISKDGLADNICFAIHNEYANANIVNFYYSLQGGTGSIMGTILAGVMREMFPEKIINVTAVLGKSNEDIGLQANSLKALDMLVNMFNEGIIDGLQILDNNSRDDKMQVNNDFIATMDRIINFDHISENGNLDSEELETLLTAKGIRTIIEFEDDDFGNGLSKACEETVFAEWLKDSHLQGVILNKKQDNDINRELIRDVFGMPNYTHSTTWNESNNIIISIGNSFNNGIVNRIKKNLSEMLKKKAEIEKQTLQQQEPVNDLDVDLNSITSATNRRKTTVSNCTPTGTRRKGTRSASALIEKYRNL